MREGTRRTGEMGVSWPALAALVAMFAAVRFLVSEGPADVAIDLVLVGALVTAAAGFSGGDAMRRPWGVAAAGQLAIALGHVAERQAWAEGLASFAPGIYVTANVLWIVAIVMFVRVFASTGLTPEWTTRQRMAVGVLGAGALVVAATGIGLELDDVSGKPMGAVAYALASTIGDAVVFVGAVLLVRLILPMSGGGIARPFMLLSTSAATYLVLDLILVTLDLGSFSGFDGGAKGLLAFADATSFAAGIAQLGLLRATRAP